MSGMFSKAIGERLVLSPLEPLVDGGPADAFERHLCRLYHSGYRNLIVDLSNVPDIDCAGIHALARAHATAGRVEGTLRIAGASPEAVRVMDSTDAAGMFELYETADEARAVKRSSCAIHFVVAGTVLCTALACSIAYRRSRRT